MPSAVVSTVPNEPPAVTSRCSAPAGTSTGGGSSDDDAPSLDDVFLHLTGHRAEERSDDTDETAGEPAGEMAR